MAKIDIILLQTIFIIITVFIINKATRIILKIFHIYFEIMFWTHSQGSVLKYDDASTKTFELYQHLIKKQVFVVNGKLKLDSMNNIVIDRRTMSSIIKA